MAVGSLNIVNVLVSVAGKEQRLVRSRSWIIAYYTDESWDIHL